MRAAPQGSAPLKLGICGYGWVTGRCYTPALRRKTSPFRVGAIADTVAGARARAAADWPDATIHRDLPDMLASGIDAVLIASPNPLHLAQTLAVLGAGLPCLVEKPMLRDRADLAELEAVVGCGLLVPAVACRHRTDTQSWLAGLAGMGQPSRLSLSWLRHRGVPHTPWHHRCADGWTGVFADLGPHLVDILGAAMDWRSAGLEPVSLRRRVDRAASTAQWFGGGGDMAVETHTAVDFSLRAAGLRVDLAVSWADQIPGDLVQLSGQGPDGSVVLEGLFGFSDDRRVAHQRVFRLGREGRLVWQQDFEPGPNLQLAGFAKVLDGFAAAIRTGRATDWRAIRFAAAIGSLLRQAA